MSKVMTKEVGNYRLGARLGEGTFGTVYKATHTCGEKVCLRMLVCVALSATRNAVTHASDATVCEQSVRLRD